MTQLIDISLQSQPLNQHKRNPKYKQSRYLIGYASHFQKPDSQNHWQFIYETQKFQFNFLFSIFTQNCSLIINAFLLNSHYQIFKIHSHLETTFLLSSLLKHQNSYQPNIDPSTGFVYFKISYFDYRNWKGGGKYLNSYNSSQIVKLFNIQKLMKSARKLSESGLKSKDYHLTSTISNNEKFYLQMSKFISKLTQANDFQQIINKRIINKKYDRLQMAETSQFVKSLNNALTSIPPREFNISEIKLQKFLTSLTQDYNKLLTLVKNKGVRSNYDTLFINQNTIKKLHELMTIMLYRRQSNSIEIFKALDAQLGKISIQLSRQDDQRLMKIMSFLQLLPKDTEYHFLDKYFRSGITIPVLLRLSLKDESLGKFLENNRISMSLETKIRIMLQLYSAVTILWEENKILLCVNRIGNIFITKNLTVKLRGLESWYRPQHHVLLEEKNEVNQKIAENLMNITKIYYKIFFNHTMIYIKPSTQHFAELSLMDYFLTKRPLQNIRNPSIMQNEFSSKGLKQLFSGLEYVFGEYIELGKRMIAEQKRKRKCQRQRFVINKSEKIEAYKQNVRKGQNSNDYSLNFLNHKHFCSWLFKMLEGITKETQ